MAGDTHVLLTVLLHHDQSKTLDEIMAHLRKTGFYRDFPPEGSELVSWVVAMSYGFIIQLRVEADKIRSLNRYMERPGALSAIRSSRPTISRPSPRPSSRSTPSTTRRTHS